MRYIAGPMPSARTALIAFLALACGASVDPNAPLETHRNEERDVTVVTPDALHDGMEHPE